MADEAERVREFETPRAHPRRIPARKPAVWFKLFRKVDRVWADANGRSFRGRSLSMMVRTVPGSDRRDAHGPAACPVEEPRRGPLGLHKRRRVWPLHEGGQASRTGEPSLRRHSMASTGRRRAPPSGASLRVSERGFLPSRCSARGAKLGLPLALRSARRRRSRPGRAQQRAATGAAVAFRGLRGPHWQWSRRQGLTSKARNDWAVRAAGATLLWRVRVRVSARGHLLTP